MGENPDAALAESLSNEKQITAETPPTFLWHTSADRVVPAQNSVAYYLELRRHEIQILSNARQWLQPRILKIISVR